MYVPLHRTGATLTDRMYQLLPSGGTRPAAVNPLPTEPCTGGRDQPRSTPSQLNHARGDAPDHGHPLPIEPCTWGTRPTAVSPHPTEPCTGGRVQPRQPPPNCTMHGGEASTACTPPSQLTGDSSADSPRLIFTRLASPGLGSTSYVHHD